MKPLKTVATLLFLVFLSQATTAQQRIWYTGIHLGTGYYQLYNKNDWSAERFRFYPITGRLNAWTVGATADYYRDNHFGFGAKLLYSRYQQDYTRDDVANGTPDAKFIQITKLRYLKLPLLLHWSSNNQAKQQVQISIGIEPSYLLSYKDYYYQSYPPYAPTSIEIRNKKSVALTANNTTKPIDFIYRRFLIGTIGQVAYCFKTADNWRFSAGLNADYDFTNAENHKAKVYQPNGEKPTYWVQDLKTFGTRLINERHKTHNRSAGFFISASIPISVD